MPTDTMAQTWLALLTANLLAEFVFARQGKAAAFILHIGVVGVLVTLALGGWQWLPVAVLAAAHLAGPLIDRLAGSQLRRLLLRQVIQVGAISGAAMAVPDALATGWGSLLPAAHLPFLLASFTLIAGAVINLKVGGRVVAGAVGPLRAQVPADLIDGLPRGSAMIGWLERGLVMLLVLVGQASGVGFLMTAKAILRFSDASNTDHRKASEYIIIGTFISFGWGLASAFGTLWALHYWLPWLAAP